MFEPDQSDQNTDFIRHMLASIGYLELGMESDAWNELEAIAPEQRHLEEVLRLRVHILVALKKYETAATLAESLIAKGIKDGGVYLDAAYAIRRTRSLSEANALLLKGEQFLEGEAVFHFNLACYACQLGEIGEAKKRLKRAIKLRADYRLQALDDQDLKPLWDSLGSL